MKAGYLKTPLYLDPAVQKLNSVDKAMAYFQS